MKAMLGKSEAIDDIVRTLKRVPKARLNVVRDLVHALAHPQEANGKGKARARKRVSLLDTPLCGMWADRDDILDSQTFARQLRKRVEARGDRRKNLR
jgi:hypothetical protein